MTFEIRAIHELGGPNLWTNRTALEIWVDLGYLKDIASTDVPGFNERLMQMLPTMIEHRCSVGERGGFFQRLQSGTYPAHILEHVTLELQTLAGTNVGYGRARAMHEDGLYRVVVRCEDAALARAAVMEARKLLLAAYMGESVDVNEAVTRIRAVCRPAILDPAFQALVKVARDRGIPTRALGPSCLLIMGQGIHQHRFRGGLTSATTAVAEEIAEDRVVYRPLLEAIGVPTPRGARVHSAEEAWDTAESLDLPVVVKPLYRDRGPGISPPLSTRSEIEAAFATAAQVSSYVAVEQFVPGDHFELLILDDRVIAASRVAQLTHDTEPIEDVTDQVHPETIAYAEQSVHLTGLDLASVTVIASNIRQCLKQQGGVIRSIDACPNLAKLRATQAPHFQAMMDRLINRSFPNGSTGRVPIVALAGGPERKVVGRLTEWLLQTIRPSGVGRVSGRTVWLNGEVVNGHFPSTFHAAQALLLNPGLETAIIEVSRQDVLLSGLPFDSCQVGLVTGIDKNASLPLPGWGFEHPEENLMRAERCVLEVVDTEGTSILTSDLSHIPSMAEKARGRLVIAGDSAVISQPQDLSGTQSGLAKVEREQSHAVVTIVNEAGEQRFVVENKLLTFAHDLISRSETALDIQATDAWMLAIASVWGITVDEKPISKALTSMAVSV